jgi:GNAT superfamily N-acetyltransferase
MARPADVKVHSLADRPDLLVPLARIRWREWSDDPGREDLQWWIDTARREIGDAGLPATFVASDTDDSVLGGMGIIETEHPEWADRGPWVVGVVVRADRRGQGIGAVLMSRLIAWAAEAGFDQLWVSTGGRAVDFYRQCGFTVAEIIPRPDQEPQFILSKG